MKLDKMMDGWMDETYKRSSFYVGMWHVVYYVHTCEK